MATQENLDLAQTLYVAYYGRPADKAGLEFWADEIEASGAAAVVSVFGNSDEYVARFGDLSSEELINSIYQQAFNRDADEGGMTFYAEKLESGELDLATIALTIVENASNDDAQDATILTNKVDAANAFTAAAGGTYAGNDAAEYAADFLSNVNEEGVTAAQVSEAVAGIPQGGTEPEPEAPSNTIDITFNTSTVGNAEEIFGTFETTTDGELVQIALPSLAVRNQQQTVTSIGKAEWDEAGRVVTTSADYTFNMSNQLGASKEYTGEFLSPLLTSESRSADSQLFIELLDIRAAGTDQPLGNLPIDGIRFQVDGEATVLRSDDIFNAKTYPELLVAIREAIAADSDLAGFTAEIGSSFTATDGGQPIPGAVGSTIILTDSQGREISNGSFTYSDQETGGFTLYGDLSTEAPESIRDLISTNLDLDNVGYGSQGGSINLAGESNTDKGVEEFNIDAENGVWLTRLESQTISGAQALKEINLNGSGYFRVGQQSDQNVFNIAQLMTQAVVPTFNEIGDIVGSAFSQAALEDNAGLVDVEKVNAQDFDGEVKLNAYLTNDVIARDMNLQDDQANPATDNVNYTYQTAGGNDQISLIVEEGVLQREDALLNINAGNGNNFVETLIVDASGRAVESVNQQLNQDFGAEQVTIVTGNGDDVVRTWGAGDATISTGAGNDVIYADNSGLLSNEADGISNGLPVEDRATRWEFNSTASGDAPTGISNSNAGLSAGANGTEQVFDAFKLQVRVDFKGFESTWVNVPHNGSQTTSLEINQAIKDAVNNDAVLQHLIEANDGNGNILDIVSLIDADNLSDLSVEFRGPLAAGASNGSGRPQLAADESGATDDLDAIQGIYTTDGAGDDATDSVVGEIAGVSSAVESDNTINAGSGNDVIVLGTGENSNDTIVLEGNFDRNSIVNFIAGSDSEDDANYDAGYDILDFSSYLGGSANFGDALGDTRSVNVTDSFSYADGVSWGSLSASDVADVYEGLGENSSFDSILLVEATGSGEGQYKAFHLNSANNSNDVNVELLGVLDFGATQDFDAANFA
ncbi:DUF4214 domain-containing protein [Halomonas sp. AOP43-A1-21]